MSKCAWLKKLLGIKENTGAKKDCCCGHEHSATPVSPATPVVPVAPVVEKTEENTAVQQ